MTSGAASRPTRPINWIKAARAAFEGLPQPVQSRALQALTIVAEGQTPDIAKPLKGFGSGVFELVLRYRGDAFRIVYAVQLSAQIWVIHCFQKKSISGIGTPKAEIDLIRSRLSRLREMLR